MYRDIKVLKGQTIRQVLVTDDELYIRTDDKCYLMYHAQDCCESVWLDDAGDVRKLEGHKIISAKEKVQYGEEDYGTSTWTFYDLESHDLHVQLVWRGESNGYYSESVEFCEISLKMYEKASNKIYKQKKNKKKGGKK